MKTYSFTMKLGSIDKYSDDELEDLANTFYENGCDDATFHITEGIMYLSFDREAESLSEAVKTAAANIRESGEFEVEFKVGTINSL
jgi:hypothetical protein